jgi:hypothetical protein
VGALQEHVSKEHGHGLVLSRRVLSRCYLLIKYYIVLVSLRLYIRVGEERRC